MSLRTILYVVAVAAGVTAFSVLLLQARVQREAARQAEIHLKRGINLYHKKDYIHAEVELRKALRINPDEWKTHFYMATVMTRQKRYPLAIPYLERALELNPREVKILNAFGVVYFKLGRLDMARGYFAAALDIDPANRPAKGLMETMAKLQRRSGQAGASAEE